MSTNEDKIKFLIKHGWDESCLYDGFYNPPSELFFKLVGAGGAYVYTVDDAYAITQKELKEGNYILMARDNFILKTLREKGEVTFSPHGNSMTPKINSGDEVRVVQVNEKVYRVGDIAYCKVKGNVYLHLITAIDESKSKRFQISNNHGHVNGWTQAGNMYGVCVQVKDKILISQHEIHERLK